MYKPYTYKGEQKKTGLTTLMAKRGVNFRDLPQLLNVEYALEIKNYLITTDGGLTSRKGQVELFSTTGGKITMFKKYTDDIYIFGHDDLVEAYYKSTDSIETIHTYSSDSEYDGQTYGDYFYITNKKEKIGRISITLPYDNQSANFTVGLKVTGATSKATGIILEDADGGATGTLTLGSVQGVFQDNETITDSSTGSAKVNGSLTWAYTTISSAPICKVLRLIGSRLYAGNLSTDSAAVAYSNQDVGTNPPFNTWTVGVNATDPGLVTDRVGGNVIDIVGLGQNIIVFQENGKYVFYIDQISNNNIVTKVDRFVMWREDMGSVSGAIVTPKGLFYLNKGGLWQLISVGQPNIPYSDQEGLQSILLGTEYFINKNLDNVDMTYVAPKNTLLITLGDDSVNNNMVIAYNTEFKSFSMFTGWHIEKFLNDDQEIYASSSTEAKTWKLFEGYTDEGADIWTSYVQELKTADLPTRSMLYGGYIDGFLSPSSDITVGFDIYTVKGLPVSKKISYNWTQDNAQGILQGFGDSEFGRSSMGGDYDDVGMSECFGGFRQYIRNYQRIRLHVTSKASVPHTLVWCRLDTRAKVDIRRRNLTLNS